MKFGQNSSFSRTRCNLGPVSDAELLQEITNLYDGEVIFGRDLDIFVQYFDVQLGGWANVPSES